VKTIKAIFIVLILALSGSLSAQIVTNSTTDSSETQKLVLIVLKNGNEFIGSIENQNKDQVVLKTATQGTLTLKWEDISSISDVKEEDISEKGFYQQHNLQSTRYFYGPNGLGLKKGEGYYQNVWILFNQVSYGFTNYFSMSVGVVPAFLLAGAPTPVWVVPKFSIPIKKEFLNIGVGGLFGTIFGEGTSFGIGFGALTIGNSNHNLSVSVGYGMVDGEWSSSPVITVAGMTRVSRKTYLLTENYFFPDNITLISFGARSFAGKVGIDYGLFIPFQAGDLYAIPWLGITVPFGNY